MINYLRIKVLFAHEIFRRLLRFTACSFSGIPYGQFLNSLAVIPRRLLAKNCKCAYKTFILQNYFHLFSFYFFSAIRTTQYAIMSLA